MAASWLALEDVAPGSGELISYPGSQRFDHFLFSNQTKGFFPARDGPEQHKRFLAQLHEQAKARGIGVERFIAKIGDVLIWYSDLAHGGAKVTLPKARRRSLVTHFVPLSVKPNYSDRLKEQYYEYAYSEYSYFTSQHFHMRDLLTQDWAGIMFDGGITAGRTQPA